MEVADCGKGSRPIVRRRDLTSEGQRVLQPVLRIHHWLSFSADLASVEATTGWLRGLYSKQVLSLISPPSAARREEKLVGLGRYRSPVVAPPTRGRHSLRISNRGSPPDSVCQNVTSITISIRLSPYACPSSIDSAAVAVQTWQFVKGCINHTRVSQTVKNWHIQVAKSAEKLASLPIPLSNRVVTD